jgi:hypothetical protein
MNALLTNLRNRARTLWLWRLATVAALIAIPITNHLTEQTMMAKTRVIVMDSKDTFYLTAAGAFEAQTKLHAELARMAAQAIYSRNPDGPDCPELIERLLGRECVETLHAAQAKDADVYRLQHVHQKVETGQIREVAVTAQQIVVNVQVQVLRDFQFNDRATGDHRTGWLTLNFVNNQDMLFGRFPLVVASYQENWRATN